MTAHVKWQYSLALALAVAIAVKVSIFLLGVAIIGPDSTRTALAACGQNGNVGASVFTPPYADLEAYTDYRDLYLRCLVTPFLNGSSAYSLPIVNNYPPLFIYVVAGFASLSNAVWSGAIPLVLFDIFTVIPVYKIAFEFFSKRDPKIAFLVSLIWIVNPINLFYSDLLWLNPAPTTFFLIFAFYFFMKEEWLYSAVFLAVSTGFKQVSAIFFPLLLILFFRAKGGFSKQLIYFVLSYVGLVLLISVPYLYENPQYYLWALSLPILGTPPGYSSAPPTFSADLSQPVRLTFFLGLIRGTNLSSFASLTYQYLDYVFATAFVIFLIYVAVHRPQFSKKDILVLAVAALSIFFGLFGRGIYKYYFAELTPMAIPFLATTRNAILFELFSVGTLLLPREVSPWMALLLITFLPGLLSGNATMVVSVSDTNVEA